jgi:hypothetical protein
MINFSTTELLVQVGVMTREEAKIGIEKFDGTDFGY